MGEGVTERLASVREKIDRAAERSGRDPGDVELLVVSKMWPAERVREVADAGQVSFGENKVQEGEGKVSVLPDHLQWHLIGHLQRNKVRRALPLFGTIHSIDSLKLARYTSNISAELGGKPEVYLQVNLAGEESKSGWAADRLEAEFSDLLALGDLRLAGLMCIPPAAAVPEDVRPWFVKLRELRDHLQTLHDHPLPGLSMGMSGDYEIAIEEGSTIVRVGSAIFGQRNYA